jgi:glutaminyl-peptide cyclotransferase
LVQDDASALDLPTIRAWCLILRLTLSEYLGLGPLNSTASAIARRSELVRPTW